MEPELIVDLIPYEEPKIPNALLGEMHPIIKQLLNVAYLPEREQMGIDKHNYRTAMHYGGK